MPSVVLDFVRKEAELPKEKMCHVPQEKNSATSMPTDVEPNEITKILNDSIPT